MLNSFYQKDLIEVGCDEAGRGCLAGPVFAAAVVFSPNFYHPELDDSKKLSAKKREYLKEVVIDNALDYSIQSVSNTEIDKINILNASILAMHKAISKLKKIKPEFAIIDGNRFKPYPGVKHKCIIKGDALYASIAAASILAKTSRDQYMKDLHAEFPQYRWDINKGYPTKQHRDAIAQYGITPYHRISFRLTNNQLKLF